MDQKFYICEHCGNVAVKVTDAGVPLVCCGQKMKELAPSTTDAALEKHVPVYQTQGNVVTVSVGSVDHPMLPAHYIGWIWLRTRQGSQLKTLEPGSRPSARFARCEGDEVAAVYADCNLHRLWKG